MEHIKKERLKKAYHFAIQDHEMAVADFMNAPSEQNTLRMSKAYDRAAMLRQRLREACNESVIEEV